MLNTINISTELKGEALDLFLKGLSKTLDLIADSHTEGDYSRHLKGEVIQPLFKVR